MRNYVQHKSLTRTEIPPGHRVWLTARKAWEEVLLDLPPDFDHDWRTLGYADTAPAAHNYEIARQACIVLAEQGRFPAWKKNALIPEDLHLIFKAIKQEMRLGREMNLPLDLTSSTPSQEDLSNVY